MRIISYTDLLFCLFLILQIVTWQIYRNVTPDFEITSQPPSKEQVEFIALGDKELLYRIEGLKIQFMGDNYGNVTPLRSYDYQKLYNWFTVIDELDRRSNLLPAIAAYYYSKTQYTPDLIYIVNYLDKHSNGQLEKNWWWLYQGVYIAHYRLGNTELALKLASKLNKAEGNEVPLWARQIIAFIYEKLGEKKAAYIIIGDLLKHYDNIPTDEQNFMKYFIEDRLGFLANE